MANTILILGRDFHPDGKETASLLADSLRPYLLKHSLQTECMLLKDLVFDISNQNVSIIHAPTKNELKDFSAVLMTNWFSHASIRKDMALTLALYFQKHNVPFFNSEALHTRSTSKLSQMIIAAYNNVAIPHTVFSLSLHHLKSYLQSISFEMPFILKDAQASRGKSNYKLNSIEEITVHSHEHSERAPFIAQTLIPSDGADFRFFMANGTPRLVIKRMGGAGSHLNNTSAGATTEVTTIEQFSQTTIEMVKTMSQLLHREVTGIDIMFDKTTNQPYFLEANPIPQIATGSNVELKLEALAKALEEAAVGRIV